MSDEWDFDYVDLPPEWGPREQEAVNEAIVAWEEQDPANWRVDERGRRYYVGPRISGDGTIDWHSDGWPE